MDTSAILEWEDRDYELRYSFKLVRKLKAAGLSFPSIYATVTANPDSPLDWADDVACVTAFFLREAGALTASDEAVWNACTQEPERMLSMMKFFYWLGAQYYGVSDSIKKKKASAAPTAVNLS